MLPIPIKKIIALATILGAGLLLASCAANSDQQPSGRLTIETPSGEEIEVACPSKREQEAALCNSSRQLINSNFPTTRMFCLGNYYSISGTLSKSGSDQQVPVSFAWDCNATVELNDLRQAVQELAQKRLGAAAGQSDY
jgi:hypothetical protein